MKAYVDRYRREVGSDGLVDPQEIALWAYQNGLHKPNPKTVIDIIAGDIAQMFREEYRVDRYGRRYRAKHAVTRKQNGQTLSLWGDLDDPNAPHSHFVKSFVRIPTKSATDSDRMPATDSEACRPPLRSVLRVVDYGWVVSLPVKSSACRLRSDSPLRAMRCALWTRRSRMASARVGSPM